MTFPRAWKQYWQDTVLPKAEDAQKKIDARMELPALWEMLGSIPVAERLVPREVLDSIR